MSDRTIETMSSIYDIARWQQDARACPEVYAVAIRCDGEHSISSIYDTREAAEIERDWYNARKRYGRAHIEVWNVMTKDLATRRFAP